MAEPGDLRRFKRLEELASIVGFIPGIYQSSAVITTGIRYQVGLVK